MDREFKARLHAMHHVGWTGTWVWLSFMTAFLVFQFLLLQVFMAGPEQPWQWGVIILSVLISAHLMHTHLIALHEAAHGLLCPVPWINDGIGLLLGTFGFLSLELYRTAHHTHHAYLATERDEELWPFVKPDAPRWFRRLAAFLELTCGLIWTPCLFLRAYFRKGTVIQNHDVRKRIAIELVAMAVVWGTLFAAFTFLHLWTVWLVGFLVPAWLAGCIQSLRKYIEHMGVSGTTALSATRSVQPTSWLGWTVSFALFNEPFHGVHHKYPRLPQEALPEFGSILIPTNEEEIAPYPSYRSALWDMLGTLGDPLVGTAALEQRVEECAKV